MKLIVQQGEFTPGKSVLVKALLTEYGIPMEHRAGCKALITRPDLSSFELALTEIEPGGFQATFNTDLQGIYRIRLMAHGTTLRGKPFTREESRTAAAFRQKPGGIRPSNPSEGGRPNDGGNNGGKLGELIARCCRRSSLLMGAIFILLLIILILMFRMMNIG